MSVKLTTLSTPVGKTIRKIRLEKKFSHADLANATGLCIDYLKKIESGKIRPPVGTLLQIARALEIDSSALLKAKAAGAKDRVSAFSKRTENYAYTTLTPGAANTHLSAFRITVEADSEHKGVGYKHHGEEFIYVLKGVIEVEVGDHRNLLKAGESVLFNSEVRHKMRNTSPQPTELLVVIYTP